MSIVQIINLKINLNGFQAFLQESIVPDVVNKPPKEKLLIRYPSGKTVNLGNEIKPVDTREKPYILFNAIPHSFYTLLMVDPDTPSRKTSSGLEFRHWLVVNIPGKQLKLGQTISEYVGSGAPRGTGLHRYTFLVFAQPRHLYFDEGYSGIYEARNRGGFSTKNFTKKYNLGDPVAGNFFVAQYDESVPSLLAQLGITIVEICPE